MELFHFASKNINFQRTENDMMSSSNLRDMSSYVAVVGTPSKAVCHVYGLTPQEVRYLKVSVIILFGFH